MAPLIVFHGTPVCHGTSLRITAVCCRHTVVSDVGKKLITATKVFPWMDLANDGKWRLIRRRYCASLSVKKIPRMITSFVIMGFHPVAGAHNLLGAVAHTSDSYPLCWGCSEEGTFWGSISLLSLSSLGDSWPNWQGLPYSQPIYCLRHHDGSPLQSWQAIYY